MTRGWFWCSALLVSAFLTNLSVARGSVEEEDHAAEEHGHEDETVNSVSRTMVAKTHALAGLSCLFCTSHIADK